MADKVPGFTQARIRVNEEGAAELEEALVRHEHWLLDMRDAVTHKDERKKLNRRINVIRRIQAETDRMLEEQGWLQDGQLQQPDA